MLIYFMAIWDTFITIRYILCSFGTFFRFWYHAPRKIWQPWLKTAQNASTTLTPGAKQREVQAEDRFRRHQLRGEPVDERGRGGPVAAAPQESIL
jgi:hypothetical protein